MTTALNTTEPIRREQPDVRTYAALNQLIEPNDVTAAALLQLMSAPELLALIRRADHVPTGLEHRLAELLGRRPAADSAQALPVALARWRKREPYANPQAALETMTRLGGGLLTPQDPRWPSQVDDLGLGRPLCLWWRAGDSALLATQAAEHNISIVGSRDASDYGNQVTTELVRAAGARGYTIVSGGAYGIDAVAHRAALSHPGWDYPQPPTITILAGGADRFYPAGNHALLSRVVERAVLYSEVPPGTAPTRFRFLNRNRLIAAFSRLVIVTEARHRSGALNTAAHAVDLGRDVAAVPGSVFSPNSAGTHRMIASGAAALIGSPGDMFDLLGETPDEQSPAPLLKDPRPRPVDGLGPSERLVYDVLSYTRGMVPDEVCAASGVPIGETLRCLTQLEARSLATTDTLTWKLVRRRT